MLVPLPCSRDFPTHTCASGSYLHASFHPGPNSPLTAPLPPAPNHPATKPGETQGSVLLFLFTCWPDVHLLQLKGTYLLIYFFLGGHKQLLFRK